MLSRPDLIEDTWKKLRAEGKLIRCERCNKETRKRGGVKRFCSDKCRVASHNDLLVRLYNEYKGKTDAKAESGTDQQGV